MRHWHYVSLAFAFTLGSSLAAQNSSQPPKKSRVSSSGLRPPAAQTSPIPQPKPQEVVEQPKAPAQQVEAQPMPSGPSLEQGGRLDLICFGGGSANKVDVATVDGQHRTSGTFDTMGGTQGSYSGSGTSSARIVKTRSQGFDDQVSLFVEGGQGRVRMPRTMLPSIRGGENGWFKLKNVKISAGEITASVAVNPLNNPKLRLDRYTGAISISGKAGDYTGACQRYDPQTTGRKF